MNKRFFCATAISLVTLAISGVLVSCALPVGRGIEPDRTTYPSELVREEHRKVSLLPSPVGAEINVSGTGISHQTTTVGRPYLEYNQSVKGDSAEHELRILPRGGGSSESSLLAQVPPIAHSVCGEQYRIHFTMYRDGTDATSGFLGIRGPWLQVNVRCPIDVLADDRSTEQVLSASSDVLDANYFDISQKTYPVSAAKLRSAVESAISSRGMSIARSTGGDEDMTGIVTNRRPFGMYGARVWEQIIVAIEPTHNGSMLTVRLVADELQLRSYSYKYSDVLNVLTPIRRDDAYKRARVFFLDVERKLTS